MAKPKSGQIKQKLIFKKRKWAYMKQHILFNTQLEDAFGPLLTILTSMQNEKFLSGISVMK